MNTSPEALIRLNGTLRTDASGMMSLWQECGSMCLTRKVQAVQQSSSGTSSVMNTFSPDMKLLNTVAIEANATLAAGCLAWITPAESPWFRFKPAAQLEGNDAAETYLAHVTDITLLWLSASNFYQRVHEMYLDRSTFGTAALWVEEGKRSPLNFRTFDVGSFVIGEDEEQQVNKMFREFEFSAEQAAERFPGLPASVQAKLSDPTKRTERERYLHCIFERPEKERQETEGGPLAMPWASVWIHIQSKEKVLESGYEELPLMAARYLKWSENSAYGASPAMMALAEIRGVQWYELLLSTLAETQVNPRVILPQGIQGVPDLRAGGITMGGLTADTHPREWATSGRLDFGLTILERKEKMIESLFHKPLFDQFSQLEREITAHEVRAREAEKLARFSPAFTALTTEMINPLLQRVFMLLFRQGKFPPPPREAILFDALGYPMFPYPRIVQTSRMALALQAVRKSAYANVLEMASVLQPLGVPVLDNFDHDAAIRDIARNDGMPDSYTVDTEARDALRKAREEAQRAAEQQAMLAEAMKSKPIAEAAVAAAA